MSSCQSILSRLISTDFRKLRQHGRRLLLVPGIVWLSCFAVAQSLPTDVDTTCIVTPSTFAGWFQTNTVTLNGVVNPANSLTFVPNSNCSFFQWSEQMFLWLNSPAPVTYGGGGGRIFNSPAFFDVSPLNSSNQRTLIAHTTGIFRPFPLPVRASKVGPDGLQVLFDKAGRMLEVQPAKIAPSGKQLILSAEGKEVETERATIENGKAVFLDKSGKPIIGAKPILKKTLQQKTAEAFRVITATPGKLPLPAKENPILIVQRFIINGSPFFIDGFGNLDPVEQGEADDSILETQNCSLVYYTIAVNDVYAYFLTGIKTNKISSNPATLTFPVTQAELTGIQNFALTKGVVFPDPDALAVEVKAAWVDASTLPDPNDYITISATIPTYTPSVGPSNCATASNATSWTSSSTKVATLALVGMHVAGSVQGHPELIWATFEHAGNTPLATYTYNGSTGVETTTQSTSGTWLFSATGSTGPFNQAHMQTSGANIQAVSPNPPNPPPPFTISPSNTLRQKPFGGATDLQPMNLSEFNATAANTDVISINNNIRGMLVSGDVRGNYMFSGATWTAGGVAPTFNTASPPNNNSNQVGNSFLTNSTLETYVQGPDSTSAHGATNCFFCHNDSGSSNQLSPNVDDGLSHIYFVLQALP